MPETKRVYFFDTVTLSNFARTDSLELLVKRYGKRLYITREVANEIAAGIVAGYAQLEEVEHLQQRGVFSAVRSKQTTHERKLFLALLRTLSAGEASAIAAAATHGGIVVTDDRAARSACEEHKVVVTGTIGILLACCRDVMITAEDADTILEKMVASGYRSPVNRISNVIG